MQARLQLIRFPSIFFAIAFALAAALSLGAVLGYTLKPGVQTPGRTEVIYVQSGPALTDSPCIWIDGKKSC
jgi:hypothetical protein